MSKKNGDSENNVNSERDSNSDSDDPEENGYIGNTDWSLWQMS